LSSVVCGPAVVVLIACNVDNTFLPGLPNDLPNHLGTPEYSQGTGGTGGASSTGGAGGGTTTSTPAGPALSECDCADSYTGGATACNTCSNTNCLAQYTTCQAGDCVGTSGATVCVFNCDDDGDCIAGCIAGHPDFQAWMSCLFLNGCADSCGVSPPLDCPLGDGGTDAGDAGDAATD
jgi:hypothetical protein